MPETSAAPAPRIQYLGEGDPTVTRLGTYTSRKWQVTSSKGGKFMVYAMFLNGAFNYWIIGAENNGWRNPLGKTFYKMCDAQGHYKSIRGELALVEDEVLPTPATTSPLN